MSTPGRIIGTAPAIAVTAVAVCWGVTFTLTAHAVDALPAADVVALRFGLAAVLITACTRRRRPLPTRLRRRGVVLGGLLGLGFLMQTAGLEHTDAMTSGLLTGLLVVVAPIIETTAFGRRHRARVWVAVGMAALGLLALTDRPSGLGPGEVLTIGAALVWALHLVLSSRWSEPDHAWGLARSQTATVAAMGVAVAAGSAVVGRGTSTSWPPVSWSTGALVLVLALVCTAVPMVLLTWAQSRLDATRTAVILTGEPAVAALTAVATGTSVDLHLLIGGLLVVGAMLLSQPRGVPSPPPVTPLRRPSCDTVCSVWSSPSSPSSVRSSPSPV